MGRRAAARQIKQVRQEILVALKMLYPAALMGEQLLRSLLILFPQLIRELGVFLLQPS